MTPEPIGCSLLYMATTTCICGKFLREDERICATCEIDRDERPTPIGPNARAILATLSGWDKVLGA